MTGIDDASIEEVQARVVCFLLDAVDPKGGWGRSDYEDWGPIITALTAEVILLCGADLDHAWYVDRQPEPFFVCLRDSLRFVSDSVRDDGSCGEDVWDASQIGRMLAKNGLEPLVPGSDRVFAYVEEYIASGKYKGGHGTWDGPGTIASLIQYCLARRAFDRATMLVQELLLLQNPNGSFTGTLGRDGTPVTSPVWHTALALRALLEHGLTENHPAISKIIEWFEQNQNAAGSWQAFQRFEVYFTAHAIVALSKLSVKPPCLAKAIRWLLTQITPLGKAADAAGTLMTAQALGSFNGFRFGARLSAIDFHNAQRFRSLYQAEKALANERDKALRDLQLQNGRLHDEIAAWQRRFGDAVFGVTNAQIFWYGIVIALVSVVAGVALPPLLAPAAPHLVAPPPAESEPVPPTGPPVDSQNVN